jgi:ferredoxin
VSLVANDPAEDEQTIREAAAACPFFAIEMR